jgi:hypothetical protein
MLSTDSLVDVPLGFWQACGVRFPLPFLYSHVAYLCTEKSLPIAFGGCAVIGGAMGIFDYSGQLSGVQESREERRNKFFKKPPKPIVELEPTSA